MYSKDDIDKRYQKEIKGFEKLRIGVACAIIDEENLLLEKRSDCGWWGLVGGSLEIGETVEECALREVLEETGLKLELKKLRLLSIYSDPKEGRILQYPDNRIHLIDIVFYYKLSVKNINISEESLEISLFKPEEIPKEIVPPAKQIINDVCKMLNKDNNQKLKPNNISK